MVSGLSPSDVVNVTATLAPIAVPLRGFGIPLFVDSFPGVVDVSERFRKYTTIEEVIADWPVTSGAYAAAIAFFSQSPQPSQCYIGFWAKSDVGGVLHGGILTTQQQLLANYTSITSGAMLAIIDGVPLNVTGLNFSTQTNLNGVASVLQTALNALSSGTTVTWNASYKRFEITSGSTGVASSVNYFAPPTANGFINFTGIPSDADTVTVNGTVVTLKTSPTGSQVQIGASAAATAQNLATALNASADVNIAKASYSVVGAKVYAIHKTVGTAGNSFTLAKSGTNIAVSGATLSGGSGTDCSATLGLTKAGTVICSGSISGTTLTVSSVSSGLVVPGTVLTGNGVAAGTVVTGQLSGAQYGGGGATYSVSISQNVLLETLTGTYNGASTPVPGAAAETALACATAMAALSNDWYALQFVSSTQPTDADHEAVGVFIEACNPSRIYLVTTSETKSLDPLDATDVGSALGALNLSRTLVQYSSSSPVAAASLFGRQASVDFTANKTTINLMWKIEPGIISEILTESQAAALKAKDINVFVKYTNQKSIIQWGTMINGDYIDERVGIDFAVNLVQTTLWNVLYQTPTKVPQTDAGTQLLVTPVKACCQMLVRDGFVAPGVWNGPPMGNLNTGDVMPLGYYVFADVYANQNPADRAARKAMPIQVALKLAGAVNTVNVMMTFDR